MEPPVTPLHVVGEFLRELLLRVPLGAARALFVGTLVVLLIWVLRLAPEETTGRAGGTHHNLKPWAALALLVQIVIYLFV